MKIIKGDADVKFNPKIKFERKYSIVVSSEEYSEYREKSPKEIVSDFKQLLADFENESEENQKEIIRYQKRVPYHKEYLFFKYWLICRNYVLLRDKFKCQINKTHSDRLVVHHNTYEHRGDDARHLDCLITFCDSCHELNEKAERESKANNNTGNNVSKTKYFLDDLETTADKLKSKGKPFKPVKVKPARKKRNNKKVAVNVNKEKEIVLVCTKPDERYINHIANVTEVYARFNSKIRNIKNFSGFF